LPSWPPAGNNEGNPRWAALQRTEAALRTGAKAANPDLWASTPMGCKRHPPAVIYLKDHEGATLTHVVGELQKFIDADRTPNMRSASRRQCRRRRRHQRSRRACRGADAGAIFGAITLLCWLTFRRLARRAVHHRAAGHLVSICAMR
jgi:hypothetical protein